jgi:hypothetical protein
MKMRAAMAALIFMYIYSYSTIMLVCKSIEEYNCDLEAGACTNVKNPMAPNQGYPKIEDVMK